MKLVLPYDDPGMDGAASAYAYAELLKNEDDGRAVGAAFGEAEDEAGLVLQHLDEELSDASYYLYNADGIVMVDASGSSNLSSRIKPSDVVEVIDNEDADYEEEFPNADVTIDEVGATSTLIAEMFRDREVELSEESALMLYMGIVVETDSLSNDTTTDRDREMKEWLEEQVEIPDELEEKVLDEDARDGDELESEYD